LLLLQVMSPTTVLLPYARTGRPGAITLSEMHCMPAGLPLSRTTA